MEYLLSLIIPVYNRKDYIGEAMDSVLCQLPQDYECIVVDDGSDDGTKECLQSLDPHQENVRIIYADHQGGSAARNRGLESARGEYIAFMDSDDCMKEEFFANTRPMLEKKKDLYIFSIERVEKDLRTGEETREIWHVDDAYYPKISEYADMYIRKRKGLIYSQSNKFYKSRIIRENNITFDQSLSFGEDRLFNFNYLMNCQNVRTSSIVMFDYIQRNDHSLSSRYIPDYFELVLMLHREKRKCFLSLTGDTTVQEQNDFIKYDIITEMQRTIDRFEAHPEEEAEGVPLMNKIIFQGPYDCDKHVDLLIILGSRKCEYRVAQAFEMHRNHPQTKYLVCGGNLYVDQTQTEAEFMRGYLISHGVDPEQVIIENQSTNTFENIEKAWMILRDIRSDNPKAVRKVGIATAGFHIPRTKQIIYQIPAFAVMDISFFPVYGKNTRPDNWYKSETGRQIIFQELVKEDIEKWQ